MYLRVSLKCIDIRSKHRSALYEGERKCGQSKNQAVEHSTYKKLLRFPVKRKPAS